MQVLLNCKLDEIDVLRIGEDVPDISAMIPESTYNDIFVLYPSSRLVEKMAGQFGERMQILEAPPNLGYSEDCKTKSDRCTQV